MPSSGSWTDVRSLQPLISDANSDIDSATLVPSDASAGSIDLGVNSDNSNQNTVADYETYSNSSSLDIAFPDNGELHPLLPINNHEDAAESEGSHNSSVFGDSFSDRGYHPLLPGRNYGYTVEFEAEPDTFSLSGTSSSDGNVLDSLLLSGEYSDVVELEVEVDTSPLIRQAFSDNIGSNSVPPSISHYATAGYEIQSYSTYLRNASEDIINRPPNRIPSSSISDRTGIHFPIRYLMASPNAAEGLSSSENTAPNAFNVSDWVHQQSLQDQLFGHTIASQSACIKTPPPRNMHPEDTKTNISNLVDPPGSFKPTRKVYGIATLLRMRETTSAVPVMLRVKPEAIAENIFQYMGASVSRRPPTRSRGVSDMSNMSRGSMMDTNDNISYPTAGPKFIGQPSRQPYAPPENSRVQANEGFVRFLKQHASPPHHRVTAGGRIVPAGPTSPPPMLDFGSLNGLVQKRTAAATSSLKQGSSNLPNARPQPIQTQPNQSVPFGGYHSGQVEGMANQSLAQVTPLQAVLPFDNGEYGAQAAVNPLVQSATNMVVTGMFPDGSTMVFLNGMNYRSYWNGANMIMEPFQPFQSSLGQQALMTSCQQFVQYSPLYGPGLQAQPASLSKPLASTTNKSQSYSSNSRGGSQSHHLSSDEFGMKTELSNLDKHLALHHYDIGLGERATMVARRKHLVQEIDKIRVSKEKPKHTIPIIAPATGLPIIQAAQSSSGPRGNQTTPLSVRQEAQKTESTKEGSFSKCLSPAAPPFIPKCMQTAASNKPGVHVVSEQATRHGHSTGMAPPVHKESTSINKRTVSGVPAKEAEAQGRKATWDSGSRVVSHSEESSSGVLDPSDPAMRVIDYEDIEYASRYLYNWDKAKKTYCTTVAEFQEAIRRVREQARMYGCEGGQSKDPAYDAEQDIWWAICDRDPIPLPAEIPDHIANPRPWNWNDSAFNCRTSSNPWGEPASMNARNSPRKLAWDPIMTENQKNKKDVSRSYYALKGQLPSVPFRDFVYDYEGNKIPVEREMAPAPITARARDENEDYSLMVGAQKGFQKASAENVKTVTALSASNHNARQAGSAMASESKADGKENVSGGDLQARLEVHTPKGKRIFSLPASAKDVAHLTTPTSKPRSSEANAAAKATKVASAHKTFQAYVEECPDTPAGPRTRPDEMRFSNPQGQCNTTSIFSNVPPEPVENPKVDNFATSHRLPTNGELKVSSATSQGGEPAQQKTQEIWHNKTLDPMTVKWMTDQGIRPPQHSSKAVTNGSGPSKSNIVSNVHRPEKVSNGYSHEVNSTSGSYTVSDGGSSSWDPSRYGPQVEPEPDVWNCWDIGAELEKRARRNQTNSLGPVTQSRSQFGPEEDIAAKVRIPTTTPTRAPIIRAYGNISAPGLGGQKGLDSYEVKSINVPSPQPSGSHHFLRGMLKSPQYSYSQPYMYSAMVHHMNGVGTAQASFPRQATRMENIMSTGPTNLSVIGSGLSAKNCLSGSRANSHLAPHATISKASSSLASSTYQAHGYLPHFGSAGKAHTSSLYQGQGNQLPPLRARVNLPSSSSYDDRQSAFAPSGYHTYVNPNSYNVSNHYHTPINFGIDGTEEIPASKTAVDSKANQHTHPALNYKGVTTADYETKRDDPDNGWHRGTVDDFFRELAETESKNMSTHQRVNTQSAAYSSRENK